MYSRLVFQGSHFGIFIGALVLQPLLNIYNHSTKKEIQEKFAFLCLWAYFFWGTPYWRPGCWGKMKGASEPGRWRKMKAAEEPRTARWYMGQDTAGQATERIVKSLDQEADGDEEVS